MTRDVENVGKKFESGAQKRKAISVTELRDKEARKLLNLLAAALLFLLSLFEIYAEVMVVFTTLLWVLWCSVKKKKRYVGFDYYIFLILSRLFF